MIVTRSRLHAVRYHRALERYLKEQGYDHAALVAFSGTVRDGGIEHTEASLNGIPETQTKDAFERAENRFLVVANCVVSRESRVAPRARKRARGKARGRGMAALLRG
jgi:hypothetical protein